MDARIGAEAFTDCNGLRGFVAPLRAGLLWLFGVFGLGRLTPGTFGRAAGVLNVFVKCSSWFLMPKKWASLFIFTTSCGF